MENVEVPVCKTKEEGLKYNVTSTGRQLGVVPAPTHGLWQVRYIDGRSGGLPEKLQGRYTGQKFAQEDITNFVNETWDVVAEVMAKAEAKAEAKAKATRKSKAAVETATEAAA